MAQLEDFVFSLFPKHLGMRYFQSGPQHSCTCCCPAIMTQSTAKQFTPRSLGSVVLLMVQRVEYVMGSHGSCGSNSAQVFLSILHFLLILKLFCFSLFCVGGKQWWGWWRETGSHVSKAGFELSIAKDELELLTLLPSPLQCWGRSRAPPYRVIVVLETKPGASYMLGQWNYILSPLLPFSWFRLWIC